MADFCRACTVGTFGDELADKNEIQSEHGVWGLCECCGYGNFEPDGTRVTKGEYAVPIETDCEHYKEEGHV